MAMTLEEFAASQAAPRMSLEDFAAAQGYVQKPSIGGFVRELGGKIAKGMASEAVGLADMALGAPGVVAGVAGDIAGRVQGMVTGEDGRALGQEYSQKMQNLGGMPWAQPLRGAVAGTAQVAGVENPLPESGFSEMLGAGIEKASTGIESATGIPAADTQSVVGAAMAGLGGRMATAGGRAIAKKLVEQPPDALSPLAYKNAAELNASRTVADTPQGAAAAGGATLDAATILGTNAEAVAAKEVAQLKTLKKSGFLGADGKPLDLETAQRTPTQEKTVVPTEGKPLAEKLAADTEAQASATAAVSAAQSIIDEAGASRLTDPALKEQVLKSIALTGGIIALQQLDPSLTDNAAMLGGAALATKGVIHPKLFTEIFKSFNESVVVDAAGTLKPLYHGGVGLADGMPSKGYGLYADGLYLTENITRANQYGRAGAVYPAYVNIRNPMTAEAYAERFGRGTISRAESKARTALLLSEGYDGIIDNINGKTWEAVAFKPETQVKSAISGITPKEQTLATDEILRKKTAEFNKYEQGAADPELLGKLAAAGTGAAIGYSMAEDNKIGGTLAGAFLGGLAPRYGKAAGHAVLDATRIALSGHPIEGMKQLIPGPISAATADDTRFRIKKEMDTAEISIRRDALERSRLSNNIIDTVPDAARRAAIAHAIEGQPGIALTAKELSAAKDVMAFFEGIGKRGIDAGVIKELLPNYVTHVYGKAAVPIIEEWMQVRQQGATTSLYGKTRVGPPTIAQVNQIMAAKGLPPIMTDIAEIIEQYGSSLSKAVANRELINTLKQRTVKVQNGAFTADIPLIQTTATAPHNYQAFGKQGLSAHPDIIPALKFAFEANSAPAVMRAIEAINTAGKRSAVSLSLFHAKNIVDAMAGAAKLQPGTIAKGAAIGAAGGAVLGEDPILYAQIGAGLAMAYPGFKIGVQAALPKVFGENPYVKALRKNDPAMAKLIDMSIQGGLEYSLKSGPLAVTEVGQDFYSGLKWLQQQVDATVPGAGKGVEAVAKLNHAVDGFMWERLHTGLKLQLFAEKYETLTLNNAKAHAADSRVPLLAEKVLAERAASFTNDIFGGLNWRRIAEEATTRWGRDLAASVYSPNGQRVMRLALFAPDWAISTVRAATKAAGRLTGETPGTNIKGLYKPETVADLHRQYLLRAGLYYGTVADGLTYAFTGEHLWDQKDWTYIPLGDGRKMQYSKHTMEPAHLVQHPAQFAINKLGQVPREITNQLMGTEYLSPRYNDKMRTITAGPAMQGSRLGHVAKTFSPIGAQQLAGGGVDAGVAGALGVPIYGRTPEDWANLKAAERERRAQDAAK